MIQVDKKTLSQLQIAMKLDVKRIIQKLKVIRITVFDIHFTILINFTHIGNGKFIIANIIQNPIIFIHITFCPPT